ncbi:MAG: hypothetical protein IK051_00880 [Rhodocyclaceae bacterium]|nr:hypothetical protein [Rhodocyclaceae bacterium]MBR4877819.1 hypothetical protein [Rhodocyclaceae bacterium]
MWKTERRFLITAMSVALLLCGCGLISDSGFATVEVTPTNIFGQYISNSWQLKLQANEDGVVVKSLKINNGACEVSSEQIEDANKRFDKKRGSVWTTIVSNCVGRIQTLEVHTNRGASTVELSYSE